MNPSWGSAATAAAALAAVLALVWLLAFVARRSRLVPRSAATGRLAVVQSVALDPRRRIQLVRCDGQHLLLLTGGPQDLMLGFLPAVPDAGPKP